MFDNPPRIELIPATPDQEPILANLLELYAYDFSQFLDIHVADNGRFGYQNLPLYWLESNRYPFLVRTESKWAGFALVKRGSEITSDASTFDLAEFFVLRRYRRRGFGTAMAHQVWQRFPGQWEVRVMGANHSAHQFWSRAVASFVGKEVPSVRVETSGKSWRVLAFESKRVF